MRYSIGRQKWAGLAMSGVQKSLSGTTSYRGQVRGGPRTAGWREESGRSRTASMGVNAGGGGPGACSVELVEITGHDRSWRGCLRLTERERKGEGLSRSSLWMPWGSEDLSKEGIVALTSTERSTEFCRARV